ncbi:MAG TPA: IS1595 family transposase [Opitutales bacterium]|jgi:transposase-like protein|nr:IS1595 family transposase [Opitutales bacterium]
MKTKPTAQPSTFDFLATIPDEDAARKHLATARWPNGVTCYHCGNNAVWTLRGGKLYTCKACRKQFTVRTGTVMEDSKLPLQKWAYAMYLMTVSRKGISSIQLAKELGITQKSAWFVGHRIREACQAEGLIGGVVEADHAYFGGKEGNKHFKKRSKTSTHGGKGKAVVFGATNRDGEHRAKVVNSSDSLDTYGALHSTVAKGAMLITDSDQTFNSMNEYGHEVINHSAKQYVRGDVHTNTIESFWAVMKRAQMGTFHHMSRKHLPRYVDEFVFKANTKSLPAFDKNGNGSSVATVREFMTGAEGKRLTYEALTANA